MKEDNVRKEEVNCSTSGDLLTEVSSGNSIKKETLYFCKTVRQLLCALLLSQTESYGDCNYLLINTYLKNLYPNIEKFACGETRCFKKVVVYSSERITSKETSSPDVLLRDIEKYYDNLLFQNDISIDKISEFNVFSALRFSLYLSQKKKRFYLYEDGHGSALKVGIVQWLNSTDKVNKRRLALEKGLIYGESEYVSKIFLYDNGQLPDTFPKEKICNFTVQNILKDFDKNTLLKIYNFFNCNEMSPPEQSNYDYVLLTQNYDINTKLPIPAFWGAIVDCLIPKGVSFAVKPHPADKTDYSSTFSSHEIINKTLPYELFERAAQIKNLVYVTSTAAANVNYNSIGLGRAYMGFNLFPLFSTLSLCVNKIEDKFTVRYIGSHQNNFAQLVSNKFKNDISLLSPEDDSQAKVLVIDGQQLSSECNNVIIVRFYDEKILTDIDIIGGAHEILLMMKAIDRNNEVVQTQVISISSDDMTVLTLFSDVHYEYILKYAKIRLVLSNITIAHVLYNKVAEMQKKIGDLEEKISIQNKMLNSAKISIAFEDI